MMGFLGRKHSLETRQKMSKSAIGKQKWLGKKHSLETKQKMSKSAIGKQRKYMQLYDKEWLSYHYSQQKQSCVSIALLLGCNGVTVWQALKKLNILMRRTFSSPMKGRHHSLQTRRKMSLAKKGEKAPHWRGGISFLPYSSEFNESLKTQIKQRDNFICQKCGSKEDLCVHHINYDKQDCRPENLITLCMSCNGKVNFERGFWMGYFLGRRQHETM